MAAGLTEELVIVDLDTQLLFLGAPYHLQGLFI
jgi:hypothetical protein